MMQPEQIRHQADRLYDRFLQAWVTGVEEFFPCEVRGRKVPRGDDLAEAIQAARRLREGSKDALGYGYTVEWREVNSRKFGRNLFPVRIAFETAADLIRFVHKQREFERFTIAVDYVRQAFPELGSWLVSHVPLLPVIVDEVEGLVAIARYLLDHPRPQLFAREIPVAVDTKFVERHQRVLRDWLDAILPPHTIRADEEHFERRFGLRYAEPHLLVRILDPRLGTQLGMPFLECSLPLHTLGLLPVHQARVLVVENKVNLLTLPLVDRGIALGGLGAGVTLLRYVPWLFHSTLTYWGDLDIEGLAILSSLRGIFPQARSMLMDRATLDRWRHLCGPGNGQAPTPPVLLTEQEQAAFFRCRDANLRLEQERLPPTGVLQAIRFDCAAADQR